MLEMILAAIGESSKSTPQVTPQVSPQVEKLLCVLFGEMTVPNKTAVDCKNID